MTKAQNPLLYRGAALGVAVALSSLALTACTSSTAGTSTGGTVHLTYLNHFNTAPGNKINAGVVAAFEKAHPNVKVDVMAVQDGTQFAKFQTLASAGNPPDVYLSGSDQMSGLLSRQVLAPIDYKAFGVADSKALASNYISGVLSGYTLSKQVYGVPEEFSNYGNWVNVKAFKEAGLEVPKTWDEVCKDGPKMLKTSNGKVVQQEIVLPTNLSASQVFVLDAIAHEYGSSLFSTDGKHSNLKAPGVQQAVSMLQDLVYKCKASVPTLNSGTQGADRIVYGSGQAAMLLTGGSWYLGSLQQQYPKVAPPASAAYQYPTVPGHAPSSTGYGYAWVVPKASKNQALAWQLVKALSDAGDKFFDQMGLFNGTNSVATSPAATKQQFWTSTWKPSLSNSNYAVGLTNSGQVYDIIGNAFTDVILHHADVKSALAQADQQIEPLLNK